MQKLYPVTRDAKTIGWQFHCPGCGYGHCIQTATDRGIYDHGEHKGDVWTFDGNIESPTIRASILVTGQYRCHSFVTAGQIQFLGDCTHALAGKTVEMVTYEYASTPD